MRVFLTVFDGFDGFEANFRLTLALFSHEGVYTEITVKSVKCVKSNIEAQGVANL